jgi:hypothetical protein
MSALLVTACQLPAFLPGGGGGGGHAKQTSHSKTTTTEEINGQPIDVPPELEEEAPRKKSRKKVAADDFGSTCKTNKDCSSNTCFVGRGELGYCTHMCNSFTDCPTHWECERAGNAPQRICMQD